MLLDRSGQRPQMHWAPNDLAASVAVSEINIAQ